MEVLVEGSGDLPAGSVLSVRAGGLQKQAAIEPSAVIRLPLSPGGEALRVELLSPVGSRCFQLTPGQEVYSVPLELADASGGQEVTLQLRVRDVSGRGPPRLGGPSGNGGVEERAGSPKRRLQTALSMRTYLDDHDVLVQMQELLQDVMAQRPSDPVEFMIQRLEEACL